MEKRNPMHPLIQEIEKAQRKENVPDFGPGDTVRVSVKVVEGGKERIQILKAPSSSARRACPARRSWSARSRTATGSSARF